MSDDIVKRMRARAATVGLGKNFGYYTDASAKTDTEAADEIMRLQARIAALEEALTLIANAPVPDTRFNGRGMVPDFDGFKVIARAALAKGEVK
jgi:hypothetical protein